MVSLVPSRGPGVTEGERKGNGFWLDSLEIKKKKNPLICRVD